MITVSIHLVTTCNLLDCFVLLSIDLMFHVSVTKEYVPSQATLYLMKCVHGIITGGYTVELI